MSASPPQAGFAFPDVIALYEGLKRQYIPADETVRALIHVHLGLALWLVLALVLRKRLSSMVPLAIAWLVIGTTEIFDISAQWPVKQDWVWQHAASDMAQSLTWPTIIWAIGFWREKPGSSSEDKTFPGFNENDH
ncbi:hypothetical protein [Croceicoccus sp. Ery5]|uniref:hypothetical protein n=1 Tax=Croceicoccus sp. Ery5 TaxID=1703340 RepID=UPI001E301E53|nr:hypothetical protein [Croceicoccus sp. Ery5]